MSDSMRRLFGRPAAPVVDLEVSNALKRLDFAKAVLFSNDENAFPDCVARFRSWIGSTRLNSVRGLESYPFAYFSHGTTQAMDHFIFRQQGKRIRLLRGEYPYLRDVLARLERSWLWLDDEPLVPGDALMISHPFSGSGAEHPSFRALLDDCERLEIPVFVDCAFFGVCGGVDFPLDHPAIETVAFSLSKIFAIGHWRVGMFFSRIPDAMLDVQSDWRYVNHMGLYVANEMMTAFDPDRVVRKYRESQNKICRAYGLEPSPTILFGIGGEDYAEFQRDHFVNRVCISAALERELNSTLA